MPKNAIDSSYIPHVACAILAICRFRQHLQWQ